MVEEQRGADAVGDEQGDDTARAVEEEHDLSEALFRLGTNDEERQIE